MADFHIWYFVSIVSHFGFGFSLPLEVGGVIFLGVPSIVRMRHVVAPAHGLSIADGVTESSKRHLDVLKSVVGASWPAHQWWLVVAPTAKVDSPAISWSLICRMAVQVLPLHHVDASNFVSLSLSVPRACQIERSTASFHIQFFPLVETNALRVCFKEPKRVTWCGYWGSLNGSIFELLTVRWATRGLSPHIEVQFLV